MQQNGVQVEQSVIEPQPAPEFSAIPTAQLAPQPPVAVASGAQQIRQQTRQSTTLLSAPQPVTPRPVRQQNRMTYNAGRYIPY